MPVQIIVVECPRCGGFDNITKNGFGKPTNPQQRYRCGDCYMRFSTFRYIHQWKKKKNDTDG